MWCAKTIGMKPQIKLFGSTLANLDAPESDVDVVCFLENRKGKIKEETSEVLMDSDILIKKDIDELFQLVQDSVTVAIKVLIPRHRWR